MISLQQLFGRDDKFFTLLEASAEEARQSAQALRKLLQHPDRAPSLEDFVKSRLKDKQLTEEISHHLVKTFFAALEREDIETLSHTLYKVPKTIEKFAERYLSSPSYVQGVDFSRQGALLEQAAGELVSMVKHLRKNTHLEKIKEENRKLQHLEGEADKLILELLGDLYSGRHDVQKVIVLKEMYELLEKVIDRCRDAGNVVIHIILKHS